MLFNHLIIDTSAKSTHEQHLTHVWTKLEPTAAARSKQVHLFQRCCHFSVLQHFNYKCDFTCLDSCKVFCKSHTPTFTSNVKPKSQESFSASRLFFSVWNASFCFYDLYLRQKWVAVDPQCSRPSQKHETQQMKQNMTKPYDKQEEGKQMTWQRLTKSSKILRMKINEQNTAADH